MYQLRSTGHRRRGVAAVIVCVALTTLIGFAAFAVDIGMVSAAKADLQRAADMAALSAVEELRAGFWEFREDNYAREYAQALSAVRLNPVLGRTVTVDAGKDVVLGNVDFDADDKIIFTPGTKRPDAVKVTIRMSKDSPNGPVPLFFARVLGQETSSIKATAIAALTGWRDIAVTIDLSGSMKHDSYLRYYTRSPINARDIWASLDGPEPSRPYIPGLEHETEYAMDTGPIIGSMDNWGDPIASGGYDIDTDPGLWRMPMGQEVDIAEVDTKLAARGYTSTQITTITGATSNQTEYINRIAVICGLAEWAPSGGSDASVSTSELTYIPYPDYRKTWVWDDYIRWVADISNNKLVNYHPEWLYRYGIKTYVDFLLDNQDNYSQTDLTHTPEEPMRAVKDGIAAMIDMCGAKDHMSLVIFASTGSHEIDLSRDRALTANRLYEMQPNHYDNSTNMGAGLQLAINELTSSRARKDVEHVIVVMSDGRSTQGTDPIIIAQQAKDAGIKIYAVSVGYDADRTTMKAIAEMTGGEEYYAAGTPEQYTAELQRIFKRIGGLRSIQLVQ